MSGVFWYLVHLIQRLLSGLPGYIPRLWRRLRIMGCYQWRDGLPRPTKWKTPCDKFIDGIVPGRSIKNADLDAKPTHCRKKRCAPATTGCNNLVGEYHCSPGRSSADTHAVMTTSRRRDSATIEITRRCLSTLPPELLAVVADFLPPNDLCSFRASCVAFQKAAWPAFAQSFNERIFMLNCDSLEELRRLASNSDCTPYIHTLNFGNRTACDCQVEAYRDWVSMNLHIRHLRTYEAAEEFFDYDRERPDSSRCVTALRYAVRQFLRVHTITLSERDHPYVLL